jgi:hypothetical protein
MRQAALGIADETYTFAKDTTDYAAFQEGGILRPEIAASVRRVDVPLGSATRGRVKRQSMVQPQRRNYR